MTRNGDVRYETKPTRICTAHQGGSALPPNDENDQDQGSGSKEDDSEFGSIFDIFGA